MVLSTVDKEGWPRARVVLLKELKKDALVFFTNFLSAKGRQMEFNPNVSALFFWPGLERQVRINGKVNRIPDEVSEAYFNSRPRESRIGAIISPQSRAIENRQVLEKAFEEMISRGESFVLKRPAHWGGYAITVEEIEFWQGRPGRLHDRIHFRRQHPGGWLKERLAP
ncbi:pyridoxamine 5'-phosphate oxidase [Lentimicrobium sp.]